MEKRILTLKIGKWLGVLIGFIMYIGTSSAFTGPVSAALGAAFGIAFWVLLKKEEIRQIGHEIALTIREAVRDSWDGEHFIEIKRIRRGMIARVYLIGSRERLERVRKAVGARLSEDTYADQVWIMQMTNLKSRNDLKAARDVLNRQLVNSILEEAEKSEK